jgi:hypothetical protein
VGTVEEPPTLDAGVLEPGAVDAAQLDDVASARPVDEPIAADAQGRRRGGRTRRDDETENQRR